MRAVQKHYSVAELALTYDFGESTIRMWMRQGLFGPDTEFLRVGTAVRVPTSGVLFFESQHKAAVEARQAANDQVKGRTLSEARRHAMAADITGEGEGNEL